MVRWYADKFGVGGVFSATIKAKMEMDIKAIADYFELPKEEKAYNKMLEETEFGEIRSSVSCDTWLTLEARYD